MTESRVTWGLPGCPQVHEQVTVIDPRHPDQLLILCHGLTSRRGKGLELWQLGLIWQRAEGTDSCGQTQIALAMSAKYQFSNSFNLHMHSADEGVRTITDD